MSRDKDRTTRSDAWAKTYRSLLADYMAALGPNVSPVKRATARQLAILSTELSVLGDRFCASGSGASTDDLNRFLKISDTVGTLLSSVGLARTLQEPANPHDAEHERRELKAIVDRILTVRRQDEARATVAASTEASAIAEAPEEPAVVEASAPPRLALHVVSSPAPPPKAEPAPVQPATDLMEQRRTLSDRCDDLRRQINQLAEPALVDADTRARRDRLQADLVLLESDLNQLKATIAKQTPPSEATRLFYENGGDRRNGFDMSPCSTWPRLRG
jgi:hypothetical protein